MARSLKTRFKQILVEKPQIKINELLEKLQLSNQNELETHLKKWKLDIYYDIKQPFIIRNTTPTPWEKLKPKLKKAGKWALSKSIPVAIGIASGGAGLGLAVAPFIDDLVAKFKSRGLNVSDDTQKTMVSTIQGKSDTSVELLIQKLERDNQKLAAENHEELLRKIKLSINEDLYPFIAEIQEILNQLGNQQQYLTDIFEDWMIEQRTILNKMDGDQKIILQNQEKNLNLTLDGLDKLEEKLYPEILSIDKNITLNNIAINETKKILLKLEGGFQAIFKELCQTSLKNMSLEELLQTSKIQFQDIKLAGKFGKPYDPLLYIQFPELEKTFTEFLKMPGSRPLFLILANIGMGKTWNAVHLGILAREIEYAIPFFIPIHLGYDEILTQIFNISKSRAGLADQIGKICQMIYENPKIKKKILLIFDGLDEYPVENRQAFFNFINQLIEGYHNSILILLTDRIIDWAKDDYCIRSHKQLKGYIYQNPIFDTIGDTYNTETPISYYLSGFTDEQLKLAIEKYGLDYEKFPKKLFILCKKPFILRLIKERKIYPDPDDPKEFGPLFWNDNEIDTILRRMDIIGSTEDLFFDIIDLFPDSKSEISEKDIKEITKNNSKTWNTILISDLILQKKKIRKKFYYINPIYRAVIEEYLMDEEEKEEQDIDKINDHRLITEPKTNTNVNIDGADVEDYINIKADEKIETNGVMGKYEENNREREIEVESDSTNSNDKNKKFNFQIALGDEALNKDEFDNAKNYYEQAKKIAETQLFDLSLRNKAIEKINLVNNAIKLDQKAKKAEKLFSENKWKQAKNIWNEILQTAQNNNILQFKKRADFKIKIINEEIEKQFLTLKNTAAEIEKEDKIKAIKEWQKVVDFAKEFELKQHLSQETSRMQSLIDDIGKQNEDFITQAKSAYSNQNYSEAIELFTISKNICEKMNWNEGVQYASQMIENVNERVSAIDKIEALKTRLDSAISNKNKIEAQNTINEIKSLNSRFDPKILTNKWISDQERIIESIVSYADYHGVSLVEEDVNVLNYFENKIGVQIRVVDEINLVDDIFGYIHKDRRVVGLALFDVGLTSLPDTFGNLTNLQILDLSSNQLTSLPDTFGNLTNLQKLSLYLNKLTPLPEILTKMTWIKELDIGLNDLTSLPDTLGNLTNLEYLSLRNNKLTSLPEILTKMTWLKSLNISGNGLTSLPDTFGNLTNLQKLYLSENQLTSLPDTFGNLTNLQKLWLYKSNLTSLPDTFGNLTNLQEVWLYRNNLTSLPDTIGNLTNLQGLYVERNKLISLPDTIGNLTNLQGLDLRWNELTSLPDTLGHLKSLKILLLEDNKLNDVPYTIMNLTHFAFVKNYKKDLNIHEAIFMVTLSLLIGEEIPMVENNKGFGFGYVVKNKKIVELKVIQKKLTFLPDTIGNLTNLKELDLSYNQLISLPDTIGNLTNLKELDLSENQLISLPDTIGNLTNLQGLDLGSNNLTSLPDTLGNLTNLQGLNLNHNQLTSLPDKLGNLTNLQRLDLNENQLISLPDTIGKLTNLKELYLYGKIFPNLPDTLVNLPNLEKLILYYGILYTLPDKKKKKIIDIFQKLEKKGCYVIKQP